MYQITALKSSIGPTIESDLTEMSAGFSYIVRDRDIDFFRRHPDVFSVGAQHFASLAPFATDESGNVTGLSGNGGVIIPIPAVVNAGIAATTVSIGAGEHTSVAIATPGYYRIDPDEDIHFRSSDASTLYGAELTSDTDAYRTTPASMASQTGLNVGTGDFTMEFWLQLTADTPNDARPFIWGWPGGAQVHPYFSCNASNVLSVGLQMKTSAGADLKDATQVALTGHTPGTALRHYVITVDRSTAGGTGTVTYYLDGSQVATQTWTESGTLDNFSASGMTNAGSFIGIGCTIVANAEWDGRIEDIKIYTGRLLSLAEVQARTNAGPLRNAGLDAADAYLTWWLNFQQSGSWANPLYPECVSGYGNAVFNTLIGSPAITVRGGAIPATTSDGKIYGGKPEVVKITDSYLALYNTALSAGNVRLTQVASA